MSYKESHGCPCDVVSISGRRNDKSIRERNKRGKNCNNLQVQAIRMIRAGKHDLVIKIPLLTKLLAYY